MCVDKTSAAVEIGERAVEEVLKMDFMIWWRIAPKAALLLNLEDRGSDSSMPEPSHGSDESSLNYLSGRTCLPGWLMVNHASERDARWNTKKQKSKKFA